MTPLSILLLPLAYPILIEAGEIEIKNGVLHIADVVEFGEKNTASKDLVGALILETLKTTNTGQSYTAAELQALIRKRVPGLDVADTLQNPERHIKIKVSSVKNTKRKVSAPCYSAAHAILPGGPITVKNTLPSPCAEHLDSSPIYYDRSASVLRARENISVGQPLGPITPANERFVDQGSQLSYKIQIGPVRVERKVTSLQSGYLGEPIFAQTEDGTILSSTLLPEPAK